MTRSEAKEYRFYAYVKLLEDDGFESSGTNLFSQ